MSERPSHPSGKPIKREPRKSGSIWRVPVDGYVTPRLRQEQKPDAIGFCVSHLPGQQSDED